MLFLLLNSFIVKLKSGTVLEKVQWVQLNPWIFRQYTNKPMHLIAKYVLALQLLRFYVVEYCSLGSSTLECLISVGLRVVVFGIFPVV